MLHMFSTTTCAAPCAGWPMPQQAWPWWMFFFSSNLYSDPSWIRLHRVQQIIHLPIVARSTCRNRFRTCSDSVQQLVLANPCPNKLGECFFIKPLFWPVMDWAAWSAANHMSSHGGKEYMQEQIQDMLRLSTTTHTSQPMPQQAWPWWVYFLYHQTFILTCYELGCTECSKLYIFPWEQGVHTGSDSGHA
jgi:hypothetical protein